MSLAGYLSEYSLAEIFHFVQEGNKSGLLSIEPERGAIRSLSDTYYLSFQGGRIMSVANSTGAEHQGLLKMMEQRRWLTREKAAELETQMPLLRQPLGTYLKSVNVINTEQLTLIFNSRVADFQNCRKTRIREHQSSTDRFSLKFDWFSTGSLRRANSTRSQQRPGNSNPRLRGWWQCYRSGLGFVSE
ncbi:DUF4388 domain-containing protein [Chamaesiphon minutus]|uniref:PatA-like N-terminal domain-containing protein n=1 Tax=Chamaesiphon minutus (strain ATCC 27169 / PCC 6605) TaxID=1173020 RepID=K9UG50_CHAP6|nr:DUF4388 domain-containing protein [Chamaesiphon minutus]AFY93648.1 hypothetical protein Cha6605_2601 [Chamaesiphon minutus PCC 6605]